MGHSRAAYTDVMCGRFTLTVDEFQELQALTGAEADRALAEHYRARYNIAPMQRHWIVREEHERRLLEPARWGLVNWWAKSRREGAKHIDARAETLAQRRPFREAFRERRCVVPADGFFEWTGDPKTRRPIWYHRADRRPFLFAGLYEVARLADEEAESATFTVITTDANRLLSEVHDRMPVILPDEEAVDEWLFPRQPPERLQGLLRPVADDLLVATPVSTRVNSVKNDDPACLAEAERGSQGALV